MRPWALRLRGRVLARLITVFSWSRRPVRFRVWHLVVAIALLVTVAITGYRDGGEDGEVGGMLAGEGAYPAGPLPSVTAAMGGRPGESPAAGPATDLAGRRLLSIDMRSGHAVLTLVRADGTERQPVWDIGTSVRPVVLPGSDELLVPMHVAPSQLDRRLEVHQLGAAGGVDGTLSRVLTEPPPGASDISPAFAEEVDTIYFIRDTRSGGGDGAAWERHTRLMKLEPGDPHPQVVPTEVELDSVSVTADGRLAVGQCANYQVVCVVATGTGEVVRRVVPLKPATMNGVAISADGRWLTYSAPVTNPFGESQIYLHDLEQDVVTMMSALPGRNRRPALAPDSSPPCLAFEHFELIEGPSVHVACLGTAPRSDEILPAAGYPVWWEA